MAMKPSLLAPLASLKFTLTNLLLLLVASVAVARESLPPTWALALPFALLAVNLVAAIACNARLRGSPALLTFHLALLAMLLLAAVGRLTYLDGWVEITEGTRFSGELSGYDAGPWHPWGLDRLDLVSRHFDLDYLPNPGASYAKLGEVRSRFVWRVADGRRFEGEIRMNEPLVIDHYRFYVAPTNKGFAPVLTWEARVSGQTPETTHVHLPRLPDLRHAQATEWHPPGSNRKLWIALDHESEFLPAEHGGDFRAPADHHLVVRDGGQRAELRPGDRLAFEDGVLHYQGLNRWLGYTVRWDITTFWILAAGVLAVLSLAWFLVERVMRSPWRTAEPGRSTSPVPDRGAAQLHVSAR